jgi:ferrochelatase
MAESRALLVMAYGTARDLDDVERYYTDIRRGNPPPRDLLEELAGRYRAIGGRSPLYDITRRQAAGIEKRLVGVKAYIGQKHSPPFIADAVADMATDGLEVAAGLVLAPHYSKMSIGDYEGRAREAAARCGWPGELRMIQSWHLEPGYVRWLAVRVRAAVGQLSEVARPSATVVFTAHSLPERIVAQGDPYADQLAETAAAVAEEASIARYRTGWQSAGRTQEKWLGPDLLEILDQLAAAGVRGVVVCPCGFVSDHLEVLYDVDIEAQERAQKLGLELRRTPSPNDDPEFLDLLATVAERALYR